MISIAKLLPREDKFYRYIESLSAEAYTSANLLKLFVTTPTDRNSIYTAIADSKNRAKQISSDITRELCLTFVTPFDREDIQGFAANLYKIPKTIEKIGEYITIYPDLPTKPLSEQAELIVREAAAMQEMVKLLISGGKLKEVAAKAQELDELENLGDQVLRRQFAALISTTQDARTLILSKDIHDLLERVIDRYRDAANIALQIVLKHS